MKGLIISVLFFIFFLACREKAQQISPSQIKPSPVEQPLESKIGKKIRQDYNMDHWAELTVDEGFLLDLKYSTKDNFTQQVIYPCPRCFLRPELAIKLKQLQADINKRYGWSLKLYDCYRPRPAQQRLWDIMPNPSYVTPPHKGSMHNRGFAIDVSLVDRDGVEFDMGTPFDHFGKKAHTDHTDLPSHVLKNRSILQKLMSLHGLSGIRTEWWHYSYRSAKAPISDWEWPCNE